MEISHLYRIFAREIPWHAKLRAARSWRPSPLLADQGHKAAVAQRDETRDLIADANPSYSESQLDTETDAAMTRAVVGALIAAGLWLLMAQTNGKGRPWARIVATVLGAINGLFLLLFLVAGLLTGLGVVSALASLVLAVTILMLLYRPESNRYYDVMSGRAGY